MYDIMLIQCKKCKKYLKWVKKMKEVNLKNKNVYNKFEVVDKISEINILNIENFDPKHIFECGQCFRWKLEEDNSYTIVANKKVLNVSLQNKKIILKNTNIEDVNNIWIDYFDLNRNYTNLKQKLGKMDDNLKEAVLFGSGIRILNQNSWEMLISFIISSNNRIPMIKKAINNICKNYGEFIQTYKGEDYYSFPSVEQINKASIQNLRDCKTGFRDKYIKETTQKILDENIDLLEIEKMDSKNCHNELIKFKGVGDKVADCIALFGMKKYDSFPVDTWVKKIMIKFYNMDEKMSLKKMRQYGQDLFGEDAGFAQQYLFYYMRETNK